MKRAACIALIIIAGCLAAAPLSAYVLQQGLALDGVTLVNLRWDPASFPLPWQLNATPGTNVSGTPAAFAGVVQQSFQSWTGVSSAKVSFKQGDNTTAGPGYDGINVVTTNVSAADWAADGGSANVLAFTITSWFPAAGGVDAAGQQVNFAGQIGEADILFNPALPFSTAATVSSNAYDLQSVLTHEIGHFLGLDHTNLVSSTMFWTTGEGVSYPRVLSADETAGISALYPTASFSSTGTMTGTVRLTSNKPVFGAMVVAVNASGQPVASALTNSSGQYTIQGLPAGSYTVYAEPLDGPISEQNVYTLERIDPNGTINTAFTTRFH